MIAHLRACVALTVLTILVCAVAYPLVLLGIGQGIFPTKANGSVVEGDAGPIGSTLMAQEFKGDEWFSSRPSASGYNAPLPDSNKLSAPSGGSNWSANNPKLRDRVARQLGASGRYKPGSRDRSLQDDIEHWFAARPDRLTEWAKRYPVLAKEWLTDNADAVTAWDKENKGEGDFYARFNRKHPGQWPVVEDKKIKPVAKGGDVQGAVFALWLEEHPAKSRDIESLPADLVTASGSGLDPHITLTGARAQLDRVAEAWGKKSKGKSAEVRAEIESILKDKAFRPLGGLAGGDELINVLEVNLALKKRLGK